MVVHDKATICYDYFYGYIRQNGYFPTTYSTNTCDPYMCINTQ